MSLAPSQTTSAAPAEASRGDEADLAWSVHLLRCAPGRLGRIVLCVCAVIAAGTLLFHNLLLALLPAAVLLLSLSEYLFPIHYRLTREIVTARHGLTLLEMRWSDVRHAYLTDEGIKLSPLRPRRSRFEALRGIFLRFGPDNREEVIAAVRALRAATDEDRGQGRHA